MSARLTTSLLTRTSPCSSQVSFSIGQITGILHFLWKSRRCLCVRLVVNQFMHGPIPHILIHESQVKYSQKHICPCVDIYSRPLNGNGNGWAILGNKIHGAIFSSAWPSVVSPPTWIIVPVSPDAANCPAFPQWSGCDGITDHSGLITYLFLLQTGQSQSWPDTTLNSRQFLQTRTLQPLKCKGHCLDTRTL